MSPFFVKYFKSTNPCELCPEKDPGDKMPGKSLCSVHLTVARLCFRLWAVARRKEGLCIVCDHKAVPNNCRCRVHREINRLRCVRWYKENIDSCTARNKKFKEDWITQGRCPGCPTHAPLQAGARRCIACRMRQAAYDSKDKATVAVFRARRRAERQNAEKNRIGAIQAKLQTMGFRWTGGTVYASRA